MTKHSLLIDNQIDRNKAVAWVMRVPVGWIIEFREQRRSDRQNRLLWTLLGDIERQKIELKGNTFKSEQWKCIFMQALGIETQVLPTIDEKSWFPAGFRSSHLSAREMSDLIELIYKFGAERGIDFREPKGMTA